MKSISFLKLLRIILIIKIIVFVIKKYLSKLKIIDTLKLNKSSYYFIQFNQFCYLEMSKTKEKNLDTKATNNESIKKGIRITLWI